MWEWGGREIVQYFGEKMRILQKTKKFEFNNGKDTTEIPIIKNNNKEKEETIEIGLRKGVIGRTEGYKYLGDHYNQERINKEKIKQRVEKES